MLFKQFLTVLFFTFYTASLCAQTQMIAHKSHSGQENTFKVSSEPNVGLVEQVDSIIQISDTTFAVVWYYTSRRDTQSLNTFWHGEPIAFDSLKNVYTGPVTFVKLEQESQSSTSTSMSKKEQRKLKKQEKKKNKNNGSLPFLFLFTGLLGALVFYFLWRNEMKVPV